ncbi:hypothetical protein F66182_8113 [Fusarium sp. NRRL 66182]|nr:hypothetical protein F66182_8113 [Fusarium sp. NRRL 66182]
MEELSQECRAHIASFLGKSALNTLVLVSKQYHIWFTESNLSRVRFQNRKPYLSRDLESFLANKNEKLVREKHQAIRAATIISMHNSGTISDALTKLIVDALSQMTGLRELTLTIRTLSAKQVHEFITRLKATQKWARVKSLKVNWPTDVVLAAFSHCDAVVLEAVHFYSWVDSPEYSALKAMCSTQRSVQLTYYLQHSLQRLCLSYRPTRHSSVVDRLEAKLEGMLEVTRDFPRLQWLFILEGPRRDTKTCFETKKDHDRFVSSQFQIPPSGWA